MPRLAAYLHGSYPRSEALVAATRDLDRGRTTRQAVDGLERRERQALVALQRQAGMDYLSDGLLGWQDLFRPLVEATRGLQARTLERWFDNNAFYRAPELDGAPELATLPAVLAADPPERAVATLPAPYLFSRAARGGADPDRRMLELTRLVLVPLTAALARRGYRLVHLEEPWLAFHGIPDRSWEPLARCLGLLREAAGNAVLMLHTYYGDVARHAERLRRLPVDAVGIDFVHTDLAALGCRWQVGLVAGCLDGRRTVLEPLQATVAFVRRAAETLDPPALYLTPTSELELLGPQAARSKLLRLGEAAASLRQELA